MYSTSQKQGSGRAQLLWLTAADAAKNVKARQRSVLGKAGGHCFSAQNWTLLLSIRVVGRLFWVEHHE